MNFVYFLPIIIAMFVCGLVSALAKTNNRQYTPRRTKKKEQADITCESLGHHHKQDKEAEETYGRRYIVHEEATEGYVVLNGIKRRIEDCKYL